MKLKGDAASGLLLGCVAFGVLSGLALVRKATWLVFFSTGALTGSLIGRALAEAWLTRHGARITWNPQSLAAVAVAGSVFGAVAVWARRFIIITATAFAGATFLCTGLEWLRERRPVSLLCLFAGAVLWQWLLATKLIKGGKV